MDKAIEIKRRAQRCILNGDLDGALAEYEKLVASADPDPYYCVLLADLLYKQGHPIDAQRRYLEAVDGYEKNGLFKNGIAVCKKMTRLSLAAIEVPGRLGKLYALDGFSTEAGLAFTQHAELLIKSDRLDEARASLKRACEMGPDVGRPHERLAELEMLVGDEEAAKVAWASAAACYERAGLMVDAKRCLSRAGGAQAAPRTDAAAIADSAPADRATVGPAEEADGPLAGEVPFAVADIRDGPASDADSALAAPVEHFRKPVFESQPAATVDVMRFGAGHWDEAPLGIDQETSVTAEASAQQVDEEPVEEAHAEEEVAQPAAQISLAGLDPGEYGVIAASERAQAKSHREPAAAEAPEDAEPEASEDEPSAEDSRAAMLAVERLGGAVSPARPGLAQLPAGAPRPPSPDAEINATPAEDAGLASVSLLLAEAQTLFHAGEREAAASSLVRAAQVYDQLGRYDSAAAIYRSLGHSPDVSLQLMVLWLKNCQKRDDRREAARVACDLGDRALNDGDFPGARDWFERARAYDPENELAARRLTHLERLQGTGSEATELVAAPSSSPSATPAAGAAAEPAPAAGAAGGLRFRTGHEEPVVVELGELIEEFRRAIEPEMASDPQGQYDLAMSYREMGLLEEAIVSFRAAGQDPAFRLRAGELAGRCLLDLGRFDDAAEAMRSALQAPDVRPAVAVDLRYQLGLALEAAGHVGEALAEFERIYAAQASYPDVAMKIRLLRRTAEAA